MATFKALPVPSEPLKAGFVQHPKPMAFTQTDLDNINAAIATGELSVEVNGRKVVYRSMDDLVKARSIVASDLQALGAPTSSVRRGSYRVSFATHRGD